MSDEQITPALLRADAAELRRWADYYAQNGFKDAADAWSRAAAALEEKAERLEQGERACRWTTEAANGMRQYRGGCGPLFGGTSLTRPTYCPDCGGRVVLGDEEGGR
jgi:hypothetical protein